LRALVKMAELAGTTMTSEELEVQITRFYRIRKTVMEMLRDRDYEVAEFEVAMTKEEFREKYGEEPKREHLVIRKAKRSNAAEHVSKFGHGLDCFFLRSQQGFKEGECGS
jgi:hypothetical protein